MPIIKLETTINADINICFDLSRSIDLHVISTASSNEKAISGTIKGLINMNESITWQATHFGIRQKLTSVITAFDRPFYFRDEQVKGVFKSIIHEHYFENLNGDTVMKDIFKFRSPLGVLGHVVDRLLLTNYLKQLLYTRNMVIKDFAESTKWKPFLNEKKN